MGTRKGKSTSTQARRRARRTQVVFSVIALLVILAFVLSLVSSP
jgi:predicted nucleic acid-binding Zn ribbon protein